MTINSPPVQGGAEGDNWGKLKDKKRRLVQLGSKIDKSYSCPFNLLNKMAKFVYIVVFCTAI